MLLWFLFNLVWITDKGYIMFNVKNILKMYTGCGTLGMIKGYMANGISRMGALNYFKDFSSVDQHLNIITAS